MHAGVPWKNKQTDRVAIFNAYNAVNTRWSLGRPPQAQVEAMPMLRRSLFREAFTKGNVEAPAPAQAKI